MKYLLFFLIMLVGCSSVPENDGIEVVPHVETELAHYAIRFSGMDFSLQAVSELLDHLDEADAEVVAFIPIPGEPGAYLVIIRRPKLDTDF